MELSKIWIGIIIPLVIGPVFIYLKTLRDEISDRKYTKNRERYKSELDTVYILLKEFYWPLYITLLSIQQYSYQIPLKNLYRYNSDDTSISSNSEENNINFNSNNLEYNEIDCDKVYHRNNQENNCDIQKKPIDMVSDSSSENFEISINISEKEKSEMGNQNINNDSSQSRKKQLFKQRNIILDKKTLQLLKQNLEAQYILAEKLIEEHITKSCIHYELNLEMIKFIKYIKIRKIIKEGTPEQEYNIEYFGISNNLENLLDTTRSVLDKTNEEYKKLINNPI